MPWAGMKYAKRKDSAGEWGGRSLSHTVTPNGKSLIAPMEI